MENRQKRRPSKSDSSHPLDGSNGGGGGGGGGAGAAARAATLSALVDEGARGELQSRVLCGELHDVEGQVGWLIDALERAQHTIELDGRAAQQNTERWEAEVRAERDASERLKTELRARQEEHESLVQRLMAAQRVNDEWQERVRTVSSEFEATSHDWQQQLQLADSKWRAMVDALRQRLSTAESKGGDTEKQLQALQLENERLTSKLRSSEEEEASLRAASRTAKAESSDLEGKLSAKSAEVEELRAVLANSRGEGASLSTSLGELSAKLARSESDLGVARRRLEELGAADKELREERAARAKAESGLAASSERCAQLEAEARELEASLEEARALKSTASELEETLSREAEELQTELSEAQEQLSSVQSKLSELTETHNEYVAKAESEKAETGGAWEEAMRTALADKEAQLTIALEGKDAAERVAQANATAIDSVSADTAAKLRSFRDALQVSESAVSTLQSTNAALERRATDAESKLAVASGKAVEAEELARVRMQMEASLAEAQAESRSLRDQIRQMVEHHTEHQSQAEVDAEDAHVLREEVARLQQSQAELEVELHDERQRRERAEAEAKKSTSEAEEVAAAAARAAAAVAEAQAKERRRDSATSSILSGMEAMGHGMAAIPRAGYEAVASIGSSYELARMLEQRERLESLQEEIRTARGESSSRALLASPGGAADKGGRGGGKGGGFFGEGLLKSLGLHGTACLGNERLHKRPGDTPARSQRLGLLGPMSYDPSGSGGGGGGRAAGSEASDDFYDEYGEGGYDYYEDEDEGEGDRPSGSPYDAPRHWSGQRETQRETPKRLDGYLASPRPLYPGDAGGGGGGGGGGSAQHATSAERKPPRPGVGTTPTAARSTARPVAQGRSGASVRSASRERPSTSAAAKGKGAERARSATPPPRDSRLPAAGSKRPPRAASRPTALAGVTSDARKRGR